MDENFRIIDANINRASEGVRVLEDIFRFKYEEVTIAGSLRELRHNVRKTLSDLSNRLLSFRDSSEDIGKEISNSSKLDAKNGFDDLISSNFKRVQEALRSIEENLKIVDEYDRSKIIESLRFESYAIEKNISKYLKMKLPHGIYGITAEKYSCGRSNIEVVKEMVRAGVKVVQYREKSHEKSFRDMFEECKEIRKITRENNVLFIVNDHIEIAKLVDADGVHIGQDDLPINEVRKLIGDKIIGLSTHSPEQASMAVMDGADYIGVGPLFKTNTKENVCDPVGLEYLNYVVKNVNIPFVAIGGIKINNLNKVLECGAQTVCLVTEIVGAENIFEQIEKIKGVLND
jgi:thiamine-phosphate pyrophosphorylase